jgi:O-acetyl-ADP-ribose deacetylase (regulator of RNase III)
MIEYYNGDIFDSDADIIVHQVNCVGTFGCGIAKKIKKKYPTCMREYFDMIDNVKKNGKNPHSLLGLCCISFYEENKAIAHLFGQYDEYTDHEALRDSLVKLRTFCEMFDYSVAIPYNMGCGLAGGNWSIIEDIIDTVFKDSKLKVQIWVRN